MKTFRLTMFIAIILYCLPFNGHAQESGLPETESDSFLATIDLDTVSTGNYFSPAITSDYTSRFDSLQVWAVIFEDHKRIDARMLYTLRDFDFSGLTRTLIDDNWMERESDGICRLLHDNGKVVFAGPITEGVYTLQLRVRGFNPDMTVFSKMVPFRNYFTQKK